MFLCFICFMLGHAFFMRFSIDVSATTLFFKRHFSVFSCHNSFQHFLSTALPAGPGRACCGQRRWAKSIFILYLQISQFMQPKSELWFSNSCTSHYLIAGPGKDKYWQLWTGICIILASLAVHFIDLVWRFWQWTLPALLCRRPQIPVRILGFQLVATTWTQIQKIGFW